MSAQVVVNFMVHSLVDLRLVIKIHAEVRLDLRLRRLFHPVIAELIFDKMSKILWMTKIWEIYSLALI